MCAALALIGVINAGIWFTTFGTPDLTVLGFPFHYFWLVAGGPAVMFVLYWAYYQYVTTSIMEEKAELKATAGEPTAAKAGAERGESDD
ncbi:hypothetical protein C493_19176 [Natronolimnohabitans innermongolicus JCM 12255]|uniref:Uncharacterized protein n=1 Tax=Natronolimnohabitans innermongolicus JCM 12255 TaxID=1227499 RepID=L9WLK8_9EURY|nr:hypothetical protein C493_19176 [Natronolimnohabitans innermongolicus JCM 12255]